MSIIYDALKKVEKVTSGGQEIQTSSSGHSKKFYFLYGIMLVLGFFIAAVFFRLITPKQAIVHRPMARLSSRPLQPVGKKSVPRPQAQPTILPSRGSVTVPEPASVLAPNKLLEKPLPSFVLNGVFFSEDGGYALINSRIVKVGDDIEGAIVQQITENSVELKYESSKIILSM